MKDNVAENHALLVSIIKNAPYGIIAIDMEGIVIKCNKLALNQLGILQKAKEIQGTPLMKHTASIPKLNKRLSQCLGAVRKAFNLNNVVIGSNTFNLKGRIIENGMIITTFDITASKEMERKIMSAVLEGQEVERRRLAKEIHDGIGPLLSTIKLHLDAIKKGMDDATEKTLLSVHNMEELVKNVSTDIRSISHALMPAALKDFGLIPTLENLVLKINNSESVNLRLFHVNMDNRIDEHIELGLYRITQELINNTLKYSQAKNITIQIIKHPNDITLTVEDDGIGFQINDHALLTTTGIGLQNVKARTEALQGTFSIDTSPGNGVTATVEIPLSLTTRA